jgi:hypothetical protein
VLHRGIEWGALEEPRPLLWRIGQGHLRPNWDTRASRSRSSAIPSIAVDPGRGGGENVRDLSVH